MVTASTGKRWGGNKYHYPISYYYCIENRWSLPKWGTEESKTQLEKKIYNGKLRTDFEPVNLLVPHHVRHWMSGWCKRCVGRRAIPTARQSAVAKMNPSSDHLLSPTVRWEVRPIIIIITSTTVLFTLDSVISSPGHLSRLRRLFSCDPPHLPEWTSLPKIIKATQYPLQHIFMSLKQHKASFVLQWLIFKTCQLCGSEWVHPS